MADETKLGAEIEPGDIVTLRGDTVQKMTVENHRQGGKVTCVWFEGQRLTRAEIDCAALMVVKE